MHKIYFDVTENAFMMLMRKFAESRNARSRYGLVSVFRDDASRSITNNPRSVIINLVVLRVACSLTIQKYN